MKPQVAPLLLLCCSLLSLAPAPAAARRRLHHDRSAHPPPPPPPYARNATAYGASASASAALCPGCEAWADALEFLYYHNLVRLASLEPPLAWSPRLASYARAWAAQRRGDCALRHSFPDGQFALGENVFWGAGPGAAWRPRDAVADWAAEGADYSYAENACAPGRECGHYRQIVWRRTTAVGCARVVCDNGGGVFITCNYYPPGNVVGERPY